MRVPAGLVKKVKRINLNVVLNWRRITWSNRGGQCWIKSAHRVKQDTYLTFKPFSPIVQTFWRTLCLFHATRPFHPTRQLVKYNRRRIFNLINPGINPSDTRTEKPWKSWTPRAANTNHLQTHETIRGSAYCMFLIKDRQKSVKSKTLMNFMKTFLCSASASTRFCITCIYFCFSVEFVSMSGHYCSFPPPPKTNEWKRVIAVLTRLLLDIKKIKYKNAEQELPVVTVPVPAWTL